MIGRDGIHYVASCGEAFGLYTEGADHERTCPACAGARARLRAPSLLSALESLREDLNDRYDGAPDSPTLWMGQGLSALSQLLDDEPAICQKLADVPFNPAT